MTVAELVVALASVIDRDSEIVIEGVGGVHGFHVNDDGQTVLDIVRGEAPDDGAHMVRAAASSSAPHRVPHRPPPRIERCRVWD